ncbi:AI-2E family transporter [Wenzhouxiangella sp. XN79A]|uniref:AI-2E family transporter n=1 Tax=Wenzhouxiangella sp. XN79A TaxID=2724193 RepID=UPI00144AA00D|nr:AI-2E family transporter [Wenzhouxiangella sp. XN79A]NKI36324.1 AI-2E family transporter [Wenzhouxiangella sp. XN79A]
MKFSFQNMFFALATVFAIFAVLVLAKTILIPIAMALLISFILLPVNRKLESWGMNTRLAAFLSLLGLVVLVLSAIALFSAQIIQSATSLSSFGDKLTGVFTDAIILLNQHVSFVDDISRDTLLAQFQEWLQGSAGALVTNTFSNTAAFFGGLVTTVIFVFLFLIYRVGLIRALMSFAAEENRSNVLRMLQNVQQVGQKYLFGITMLILILGILNSVGLWIIGIENPFFFGFLAASLSIIPFVGTLLGATIVVVYAFMTHDSLFVLLAVIGLFWAVQTLEGNFLNPRIVGSSVNVNALAAILSLIIGASVWGIAGMILFLPFAAMLKVVCNEFEQLRPLGMLISSDISETQKGTSGRTGRWLRKLKGLVARR